MKEKNINTTEYIKIIKESPEKKKSYIFFGFSIFATILLIVFAIRPTITTISRINNEIKGKTRTNELLELIFPVKENHSLFLANIEAIVARNGYSLSSVKFDRYKGDGQVNTTVLIPQSVSFTIRGRQANIVGLLRELEELPMYPVVESLSYSTQEGTDGLSSFAVNLRIYGIENDKFYN